MSSKSGWKKNSSAISAFGHKFQPIDSTKRRCKICRLPLNSEVFASGDGQAFGCFNIGCKISRVHLSCMQSVPACKRVLLTGSGQGYRSKTARGNNPNDREINLNFYQVKINEEETQGGG